MQLEKMIFVSSLNVWWKPKDQEQQKSGKKRWFDNECKIMRKELRKSGRQLFVNPENHDIRNNYFRKKKMFQKMVKHKKREIKQMIIN